MIKKLRLGPLPKTKLVRITIVISAQLKDTLDLYPALHSETTGEKNEVARLIPHMLDRLWPRTAHFGLPVAIERF
jgi:hypothetical protein